jgi:hypothetical protein
MHRQGYDLQLTQYDEKVGARPSTRVGWAADAARGVGGIVRGILDDEIALTPGNFFLVPVSIPRSRGTVRSSPAFTDRCALS